MKGIQDDGRAGDQGVEKMPERREGLVLGGGRDGQVAKEASGQAGRDVDQLDLLALAELEEPPDGPGVGPAGLGVGDPGGEELVRSEAGGAAGALQHRRERLRGELPATGLEGSEVGQRVGHTVYGKGLYRTLPLDGLWVTHKRKARKNPGVAKIRGRERL